MGWTLENTLGLGFEFEASNLDLVVIGRHPSSDEKEAVEVMQRERET